MNLLKYVLEGVCDPSGNLMYDTGLGLRLGQAKDE